MLDALRRGANSWVLKPLMLLLVLAFIVWGVADVFTGFRAGSLASVGNSEISIDEYQRTYGLVMDNFARRFGRRPTAEEARQRGLDRAVLEDMLNTAVLDEEAHNLGLALPVKSIVTAVQKDPNFTGADGKFDNLAFNQYLRETGFTERGWIALRRKEEVRQQLTQSMFQDLPVPTAMIDLVNSFREETRTLQYFNIVPDKVAKVGEPDEAQIKETYNAQQRQFVTTEYRRLGMLRLTAEDIKKRLNITDEQVRKAFDADKEAAVVPEKRHVQQLAFKDKAAAEAAAKAIEQGKSFLDVAKENGASESDIDLGDTTKAQMLDPKIADAAFALAKDKVSTPIDGRYSTVLVRVTSITPGKVRTFDEMKGEIRDKLAASQMNDELRKLHDAVDDGRSAGKPLKEIAAAIGATYSEIESADRVGRKPDGTLAYQGPDAMVLLKAGFEGKPGIESEPVDLPDGGTAWVDVLDITAERQKPFEEVKADVAKVWKEIESARQVSELAAKLIERAGKGETMTALAGEVGAKLMTTKAFKRFGDQVDVPTTAVQRAFALPLGGLASTDSAVSGGSDEKGRLVFRVVEITKGPAPSKEQAEQITTQLRGERQQDAIQAFVGALREQIGVSVNEAVFKRAVGSSGDQ